MAFKLPEAVQETSTTTGTGTLTLLGAVSGYFSFSSQFSNGDTTFYVIGDGVDIEVGIGTYTNTSGQQLSRDTVIYSTAGGSQVNWTTGTRNVFSGLPGAVLASLLVPGASNGMLAQTAERTYARRTITGTADQIAVANGDGVAGNPTLSLPFTVTDFAKQLLDDLTFAAMRSTLSVYSTSLVDSKDAAVQAAAAADATTKADAAEADAVTTANAYTDSEIAALDVPAVTGDYIIGFHSYTGSVGSTAVSKAEVRAPRDGTYNVILRLKKDNDSGTFHGRIYVNDVATGTLRSHSSTGVGYYEEDIAVSAGDIVQLYLDDSNGDTVTDCRIALAEGAPVQFSFPYSTALNWVS